MAQKNVIIVVTLGGVVTNKWGALTISTFILVYLMNIFWYHMNYFRLVHYSYVTVHLAYFPFIIVSISYFCCQWSQYIVANRCWPEMCIYTVNCHMLFFCYSSSHISLFGHFSFLPHLFASFIFSLLLPLFSHLSYTSYPSPPSYLSHFMLSIAPPHDCPNIFPNDCPNNCFPSSCPI